MCRGLYTRMHKICHDICSCYQNCFWPLRGETSFDRVLKKKKKTTRKRLHVLWRFCPPYTCVIILHNTMTFFEVITGIIIRLLLWFFFFAVPWSAPRTVRHTRRDVVPGTRPMRYYYYFITQTTRSFFVSLVSYVRATVVLYYPYDIVHIPRARFPTGRL